MQDVLAIVINVAHQHMLQMEIEFKNLSSWIVSKYTPLAISVIVLLHVPTCSSSSLPPPPPQPAPLFAAAGGDFIFQGKALAVFDPEIEKTLHKQKKLAENEYALALVDNTKVENRAIERIVKMAQPNQVSVYDFARPSQANAAKAIVQPDINGNFELKEETVRSVLNTVCVFFPRKFGVVAAQGSLKSRSSLMLPFKPSRNIHMENKVNSTSRGALIILEGLDRYGKTSQSSRLYKYLDEQGHSVESWRFPDRDTGVGKMISSYLANKAQLDDHAIHLLFSANRWDKRHRLKEKLRGTSLIIDRYSYSGVAFSSAKGLDIECCKASEVGLLDPDLVVYLDISPEKAAERGGYGGERYEQLEFQKKVSKSYLALHGR
ncbi:thymidylate kinase-like [Lycium ferocissimum]|uniref:thymidylate kinase-like n=1 Tax=Lycium ferocissimum TaxID=112874 RepID=UPI0028150C43|nr:thymidylate kinase-like [Lycium ferocissimum]